MKGKKYVHEKNLDWNQFCEKQVHPPKRFFPARGFITY
jgi:hypothetical protein